MGKYRKTENSDLLGEGTAFQLAVGREGMFPGLRERSGASGLGTWESGGAPWDLKGELQEAGGGPQELMGGGEGGWFWEMGNCVCVCVCVLLTGNSPSIKVTILWAFLGACQW